MAKDRYELDGRIWLSIARAAKLLGTNAQGIRKLMNEDALDWRQTRANSARFVVDEQAVMALAKERPPRRVKKLGLSPDPLARKHIDPFPEGRGPVARGGGMFDAHRIRVTLAPAPKDEGKKVDPGSSPG